MSANFGEVVHTYLELLEKPLIWYHIAVAKESDGTTWPHRLVVRTAGFHPANWGPIPHGVTKWRCGFDPHREDSILS